jgi:hypothetical protein
MTTICNLASISLHRKYHGSLVEAFHPDYILSEIPRVLELEDQGSKEPPCEKRPALVVFDLDQLITM